MLAQPGCTHACSLCKQAGPYRGAGRMHAGPCQKPLLPQGKQPAQPCRRHAGEHWQPQAPRQAPLLVAFAAAHDAKVVQRGPSLAHLQRSAGRACAAGAAGGCLGAYRARAVAGLGGTRLRGAATGKRPAGLPHLGPSACSLAPAWLRHGSGLRKQGTHSRLPSAPAAGTPEHAPLPRRSGKGPPKQTHHCRGAGVPEDTVAFGSGKQLGVGVCGGPGGQQVVGAAQADGPQPPGCLFWYSVACSSGESSQAAAAHLSSPLLCSARSGATGSRLSICALQHQRHKEQRLCSGARAAHRQRMWCCARRARRGGSGNPWHSPSHRRST